MISNMDHVELKSRRADLKRDNPALVDFGETNLYRSLATAYPDQFGPITPSTDARSKHRCHLAELILSALNLESELRSRLLISHGVRRSLLSLFQTLARMGKTIWIPADVYPVYAEIARTAGIDFAKYAAREGLPNRDALNTRDALLICDPLKPWGGSLSAAQCESLLAWSKDGSRLVIIDGAYSFVPSMAVLELARSNGCALLGSLSKGWLIPDHGGYCLLPHSWCFAAKPAFQSLPKDERRFQISFSALVQHAQRPHSVHAQLTRLAEDFRSQAARLGVPASNVNGYFATTPLGFDELLRRGCIGIPASVFGASARSGCVLSTLPPVVAVAGSLQP